LIILFTLVVLLVVSCNGSTGLEDESSSEIKTIHPATLTAISAEAKKSITPEPDPMGIPWSSLKGLEIEFWYLWDLDEPGIGMNAIVDRFNRDNEWGITVTSIDQGLTHDPLLVVETAFDEGFVPHLMVGDAAVVSGWYQDGLTLDLTSFLEDPTVGLTSQELGDYYRGIFQPYLLPDEIRPGLPFSQSIQVIYYNQSWGDELGFSAPPDSSIELSKQSCKAAGQTDLDQETPAGIILYPEAANLAGWIFAFRGQIQEPGTEVYSFYSPEIRAVAQEWIELRDQGCGGMISQYPNPMAREIEFERFNQRQSLMVMASAQDLNLVSMGPSRTGLPDNWLMLPFLGPDNKKAVPSRIQAGAIFDTTPEHELGAWLFLRYLTSPEIQAEWSMYSGYYPTRQDSIKFLDDFQEDHPDWAKGLSLLRYAQTQPVSPSWEIVQQAMGDAFEVVLQGQAEEIDSILLALGRTARELTEISD
jgi:ABC-type glycerol-3-phosphate transport system substrate-binding protein